MLRVADGRQVRVAKGDSGSLRHLMCLRRGGEKDAEKWGGRMKACRLLPLCSGGLDSLCFIWC